MTTPDLTFDYIVLTPPGPTEATLAIAGSRAGAIGVLNLEFADLVDDAAAAIDRLIRLGRGRRGILLDGQSEELLHQIVTGTGEKLDYILITASSAVRLANSVELIHRYGARSFVVASNVGVALQAQSAGADAVIAKGHEAGGWVGDETTFVLLQNLIERLSIPVWAYGGIGLHTVAAAAVGGCAGVVLDSQLLLANESPLSEDARSRLQIMDGSETLTVGAPYGESFRIYSRPGLPVCDHARQLEAAAVRSDGADGASRHEWRAWIRAAVGFRDVSRELLAIGQDAAFAPNLARRFVTVGGILTAFRHAVAENIRVARASRPLDAGANLAASHGTTYPIVQGPMTRVSDRSRFALAVAEAGALPFLALALMRSADVEALLLETRNLLGARPWGVGVLGFVPPELRAEQLDAIQKIRPPFALIAGGRPDQARVLEEQGIRTYLHVPSPGLLSMFLDDGARRFIFEGRECGGHVGPRTSFVLWNSMIDVLLAKLKLSAANSEFHVLFAGGIHDARSAAMVSALAAPLVSLGVRVGVLVGTAYLFTSEAVDSGAILPGFQSAALTCSETVLLESGPGHATRCVPSPFVEDFNREKRALLRTGLASEDVRGKLEELNVGRLRIASKGVERNPAYGQNSREPRLRPVAADDQSRRGMYMIGQVAALRDSVCTLAELHQSIAVGGVRLLNDVSESSSVSVKAIRPAAIAIVGMGCILPGATDLATYWSNILNKVNSVTEVPLDRWDWRQYYDPDKSAPDKSYSRWGGFLADVPFDPLEFGMPPNSLASIEPFQLLALTVVRDALRDAGLADRPFPRDRTSVILGAGGGSGDLTVGYTVRSTLPSLFGDAGQNLVDLLDGVLPEWTEDSFAGFLLNVASGRVANRMDFGGVNYTIDAACASSLAAVYHGVRELEVGTSDVVVVGGVDAIQNPFAYMAFSKTQALSPTGRCLTFDSKADGIAISEGFAAVVLKRLEDAERDGDRIYAVIRGAGGSSDGRSRSLTAPHPEGQMRALTRAYSQAGYSPSTVGLIEAHGTGTVAGDQAEIEALSRFFVDGGAAVQQTGIGSVKSMIGHTKATAGVAGLIKAALALHHRVLPATIGVTEPNPKANFSASPFYVNSETRPWVHSDVAQTRRAGVSAFGFGGTNFHVALEEYSDDVIPFRSSPVQTWPAELFLWRANSRLGLGLVISSLLDQLRQGAKPRLADLARSIARQWNLDRPSSLAGNPSIAGQLAKTSDVCLSIVATSVDDLVEKLQLARPIVDGTVARRHDPRGIHFADRGYGFEGQIAFLFPGQGSQYVNMLGEIAVAFPEVRETIEKADVVLSDRLITPLSRYIFPPPAFSSDVEKRQQAELTETDIAQAALGATDLAMYRLIRSFGINAAMVAGHSYGEFVALAVAGCFDETTLLILSEARGRFIREGAGDDAGTMAAIDAGAADLRPILADIDVTLANLNAPKQTVISGSRAAIDAAMAKCTKAGLRPKLLPVACAFHSPLVGAAQRHLAALLQQTAVTSPTMPVFSNTTAGMYPSSPAEIVDLLSDHLVRPVEFVREINAMYDAGARIFVEVGPRSVLTGLVSRILTERPHVALSFDQPGRPGVVQLLHGLATLAAEGVNVDADRLFSGRTTKQLDLRHLVRDSAPKPLSSSTWMINGGRATPLAAWKNTPKTPVKITLDNRAETDPVGIHGEDSAVTVTPPLANSLQPVVEAEPRGETMRSSRVPGDVAINGNSFGLSNGTRPVEVEEGQGETRSIVGTDGSNDVMLQFQSVMKRFLETQQNVMMAYLRANPAVGPRGSVSATGLPVQSHPPRVSPAPIARNEPVPAQLRALNGLTTRPSPVVQLVSPSRGHAQPASDRPSIGATVHVANSTAVAASGSGERIPTALLETVGLPVSSQQVTDRLLTIVSERTGYPTEMLGLDADLEADLGIDSIKRVEIVGSIVKALQLPSDRKVDFEPLTSSRSLRALVSKLTDAISGPSASPFVTPRSSTSEGDQRPFEGSPSATSVSRFLLRPAAARSTNDLGTLAASGVVVVTDDHTGVASALVHRLTTRGISAIRISDRLDESDNDGSSFVGILSTSEGVAQLVEAIHARFGSISGLVHLAPLQKGEVDRGFDPVEWHKTLSRDLDSLFLLTKALASYLKKAASEGGAVVLGVTRLGGTYAQHPVGSFFPGHGANSGYLKSWAQEAPGVRVRSIDFDNTDNDAIVCSVWNEMFSVENLVEVGYVKSERTYLQLVETITPLSSEISPIDNDSVVLITGGARGITAEVARELVRRAQPTLVIVGRTTLAIESEDFPVAGVSEPVVLRRLILERRRKAALDVTARAIESEYLGIVRSREVNQNLAYLRAAGARVEYVTCDVSDAEAFGRLIDQIYDRHGRIDGIIHGAGIIEDKLVQDKSLESFQRVIRTKVDSALVLAMKVRPEKLRFLVFFSSIAGRLGNRGQSDYSAGNEILNKVAQKLATTWSRRVVAINWGPWATLGMATPEIQRQFAERGMAVVPLDIGRKMLVSELVHGSQIDVEVVVAGGAAVFDANSTGATAWCASSVVGR